MPALYRHAKYLIKDIGVVLEGALEHFERGELYLKEKTWSDIG